MTSSAMGILRIVASLVRWHSYVWLPAQFATRKRMGGVANTPHLLLCIVDHFEPSRMAQEEGIDMVTDWCKHYAESTVEFSDSHGRRPQHTWFYRVDYPEARCLEPLRRAVFDGLGEIEVHLHHAWDDDTSFRGRIETAIAWLRNYSVTQVMSATAESRFAYIAGNWALDNGRFESQYSGCNSEIKILSDLGCYADYTFPAFGTVAQPKQTNSLYHVVDDARAKSYDSGQPLAVGESAKGDLVIMQGPLIPDFATGYIESAAIERSTPFFSKRVDYWLKANVTVVGRDDWIFVKLHTHGMQNRDTLFGRDFPELHRELQRRAAAGDLHLHYVSAREAYNIALAAQAGKSGDPSEYRDFAIAKPVIKSCFFSGQSTAISTSDKCVTIQMHEPGNLLINQDHIGVVKYRWSESATVTVNLQTGQIDQHED